MNNKEAFVIFNSKPSIRAATEELLNIFQQPDSEFHFISRKFRELKSSRESYVKKRNLCTWEDLMFYSPRIKRPAEKIPPVANTIFNVDLSAEIRKDLSKLTLKGLRSRLAPLLQLIRQIAEKEDVSPKTIAAHALQLISNESKDLSTANFCKEIISKGTFADNSKIMSIDKSTFLLDPLEIGKQKYTSFRLICKSEDIIFPSYSKLAEYRKDAVLVNELTYVNNVHNVTIGISLSYRRILFQSLLRLFQSLPPIVDSEFPLSVKIADSLDGSGCHQIYNHYQLNPTPSSKNFILFAFKILSIQNSSNIQIWKNNSPNSSFGVRPVVLLAQKECIENVKFIMTNFINPEASVIEQEGIQFPEGVVRVKIIRSMLDGKMSGILSGAGGASCQLCTAHKQELKDLELVRAGFPINRHIADAKELFNYVDTDEYLSLPHVDRLGITHEPLSDINILSASPLHSYTCVFHWFMLLVYHLKSGWLVWSPTSKPIETANFSLKKLVSE